MVTASLEMFITYLNTLDEDLKYTMEVGENVICLLDLKTAIDNNKMTTTVYSKPTDSHLYLEASSCHNESSKNGIIKGVALRLKRICSTVEEFQKKSSEYMAYLVARGHSPQRVKSEFDKISVISRNECRKKVVRSNQDKKIIFSSIYNTRGPDISSIINKHYHLIKNTPNLQKLYPNGSILVANKRAENLKQLLVRGDPYNIIDDLAQNKDLGYKKCGKKCDSCNNFVNETTFVKCNATSRKFYIRRESTCSTPNIIYMAYCKKCNKQGIGSTIRWKPRLSNYKSHIKKKIKSCNIVKHFIDECNDNDDPCKYLSFVIIDHVNNTTNLTSKQIDELLLQKEKFWIGTLVTQHKGMNGSHDWNRKNRSDKSA